MIHITYASGFIAGFPTSYSIRDVLVIVIQVLDRFSYYPSNFIKKTMSQLELPASEIDVHRNRTLTILLVSINLEMLCRNFG